MSFCASVQSRGVILLDPGSDILPFRGIIDADHTSLAN